MVSATAAGWTACRRDGWAFRGASRAPLAACPFKSPASATTRATPKHPSSAPVAACSSHASQLSKERGLGLPTFQEAFQAEHPGLLDAIAAAAAGLEPPAAARLLRRLEAELPPALTQVAPGGDCVLVAVSPGLLPLLERAADCCDASLAASEAACAAATARAALSLLASLRFGCKDTAEPYVAVAIRCKQALQAAYDAGADITQLDVVELEGTCARASPWLWLTPYFGHRYVAAVDGFLAWGWDSAELAVRYAESYTTLLARGRYHAVEAKYSRVMRAALGHRLSFEHTERLLAAMDRLPVEASIALDLHARSHPADNLRQQLQLAHAERQQERMQRRRLAATLAQRAAAAGGADAGQWRRQLVQRGTVPAGHMRQSA